MAIVRVDPDFRDLRGHELLQARPARADEAAVLRLTVDPTGTADRRPSVAVAFDLGAGRAAIVQTSLAMFLDAADQFRAEYGHLLPKEPHAR